MERYSQRRTDCRRSAAMPGQGCGCNHMTPRNPSCGCNHPMPGQAGCGPTPRGGSCNGSMTGNRDTGRGGSCGCNNPMNRNHSRGGCGNSMDRRDSRGTSCGCGNSKDRRDFRDTSCGCDNSKDRRDSRDTSCGCEGSTGRRDSRDTSCGCESSMTERADSSCRFAADYNVCRPGSCISEANAKVGMGCVPWQQWECTYPLDRGLFIGTVFPSLDKPFVIGRCAVRP